MTSSWRDRERPTDGDSDGSANSGNDVIAGDNALMLLWTDGFTPPGYAVTAPRPRAVYASEHRQDPGGQDRIAAAAEDVIIGGAAGDVWTATRATTGDGRQRLLDRLTRAADFTDPRFGPCRTA